MQKYFKKLTRGTIVIFVFLGLSALISYFLKLFFARTISQEEIGLFYATLGFITFFKFLRDFGISDSLVYFIPYYLSKKLKKNIKSIILLAIKFQLLVSIFFIFLILIFSKTLSTLYFNNAQASLILIFLSFYYLIDSVQEVLFKSFQGFQNMFLNQLINFSFLFFSTLGIILVILFDLNIFYLGVIYALAALINSIIFSIVFFKKTFLDFFNYSTNNSKSFKKTILDYSRPLMIGNFSSQVFGNQTLMIITYFLGVESVALYVYAYSLARISVYFSKSLNQVFAPMVSELWSKKQNINLKKIHDNIFKFFFLISMPIILLLIVFSDELLGLLFGASFKIASTLLKLLSIYFLFFNLVSTYKSIFNNIGKPKISRNTTFILVVTNLILSYILIPLFGINGAGTADLIAMIISFIYIYVCQLSLIKWHLPYFDIFKISLFSTCFVIVPSILRNLLNTSIFYKIILSSVFAGIIYICLLFISNTIRIRDINSVLRNILK